MDSSMGLILACDFEALAGSPALLVPVWRNPASVGHTCGPTDRRGIEGYARVPRHFDLREGVSGPAASSSEISTRLTPPIGPAPATSRYRRCDGGTGGRGNTTTVRLREGRLGRLDGRVVPSRPVGTRVARARVIVHSRTFVRYRASKPYAKSKLPVTRRIAYKEWSVRYRRPVGATGSTRAARRFGPGRVVASVPLLPDDGGLPPTADGRSRRALVSRGAFSRQVVPLRNRSRRRFTPMLSCPGRRPNRSLPAAPVTEPPSPASHVTPAADRRLPPRSFHPWPQNLPLVARRTVRGCEPAPHSACTSLSRWAAAAGGTRGFRRRAWCSPHMKKDLAIARSTTSGSTVTYGTPTRVLPTVRAAP
jgi:hypothetical protein